VPPTSSWSTRRHHRQNAGAYRAVNVTVTNTDTSTGTLTNGYTYAAIRPQRRRRGRPGRHLLPG
jgi:hypothetical protein